MVKHVFFSKKGKRDFPKTSKNSDFFEEGYDDRTLLKIQSHKIRKEILGGICWTSGLCFKKNKLDLVRKNTIEKKQSEKGTKQKKKDRTKKFHKERWTIQKGVIFNKKKQTKKIKKSKNRDKHKQKKHKRE